MKSGTLLCEIVNTVMDIDCVMAPAGANVTILEDHGNVYEVAYYDGKAPSTTFWVRADQVRIHHE